MDALAILDLLEHTGAMVRNAEDGRHSVVSKNGKPLFVAVPFTDALLSAAVWVSLADKLVQSGELSVAAGAKLSGMPYALYLQHVGTMGHSLLDESAPLADELALLT